MKEGWERTGASASLDVKKIDELLKPVFHGKRVISAERSGTGLSNANYKIRVDGIEEPYVFRVYRGDRDILGKEVTISDMVRENVPVPYVLFADASGAKYERPWAVMEWKDGVLLRDAMRQGGDGQAASAAVSVGSVLARIHSYTFPAAGFFGADLTIERPFAMDRNRLVDFIEQSLFANTAGRWLGEDLKQALWAFTQTNALVFSEREEAAVLVHSDFNGLNILVENGGSDRNVTAVLDWEDAFSYSRYADIGNMLRYEEEGSPFETHFIRGYQENGGELAPHWRLLSKLEDLIALCDMLNQSTARTPNRIRDLQRLIAGTVRRR